VLLSRYRWRINKTSNIKVHWRTCGYCLNLYFFMICMYKHNALCLMITLIAACFLHLLICTLINSSPIALPTVTCVMLMSIMFFYFIMVVFLFFSSVHVFLLFLCCFCLFQSGTAIFSTSESSFLAVAFIQLLGLKFV